MTEFDKTYLNIQLTSLEFNPLLLEKIEPDLKILDSTTRIPNIEKEALRELKEAVELLNQKFRYDLNVLFSMGESIDEVDQYLKDQVELLGETRLPDVAPLPNDGGGDK